MAPRRRPTEYSRRHRRVPTAAIKVAEAITAVASAVAALATLVHYLT